MSGLLFIGTLFKAIGVAGVLCGAAVALLGTGPPLKSERMRPWLAEKWHRIEQTPWPEIPSRQVLWGLTVLNGVINKYFVEADRAAAFNALFIALTFILLPAAAAINMVAGGSPFLFRVYISCLAALLVLNFIGEIKKFAVINGLLSIYLAAVLLLLAPLYVLHSFTDRILTEVIGHAMLSSIPTAILALIVAYALMRAFHALFTGHETSSNHRFVNAFMAALPIAYVMFFMAMLVGHFAAYETPKMSWTLLISALVFTALSWPVTMTILANIRYSSLALLLSLATVAALSSAVYFFAYPELGLSHAINVLQGFNDNGNQVYLGSDFWVSHLPFLPVGFFSIVVIVGLLAKVISSFPGQIKPYQQSGMLCALSGALLWVIGMNI